MAKQYAPGDILYEGKPYCCVLSPKNFETFCSNCFKRHPDLKRCSSCKTVRYCKAACQKSDWSLHKKECKPLAECTPRIPTESVLLMHRLICRYNKGDHDSVREEFLGQSRCFNSLMHHRENIKKDVKRMEEFVEILKTLDRFNPSLKLPMENQAILVLEMYGRVCTNSFSICDEGMISIGVGIYLGPSLLDHSCDPNVAPIFDGNHMQIRAIRPIATKEQILMNYISLMADREERQLQLEEQYYFTCRCEECAKCPQHSKELDMHCTTCEYDGCSNAIKEFPASEFRSCDCCGYNNFDISYARKKRRWEDQVRGVLPDCKVLLNAKEYEPLKNYSESTVGQVCPVLHLYNILRVKLHQYAMEACMELKEWDRVIFHGKMILPAYRKYHTKYHPMVGTKLAEVGKVFLNLEQQVDAIKYFIQAADVLKVSHGPKHPVYIQISALLGQAQLELQLTRKDDDH